MAIGKMLKPQAPKKNIKTLSKTFQVKQVMGSSGNVMNQEGGRTCGATRGRCGGAEMHGVGNFGANINPAYNIKSNKAKF
jgi:hypothetical protein